MLRRLRARADRERLHDGHDGRARRLLLPAPALRRERRDERHVEHLRVRHGREEVHGRLGGPVDQGERDVLEERVGAGVGVRDRAS
jgi:hypothetical protein